jgi:hypothetical protein
LVASDLIDSWDDVPTALRPVAPMTGPFPTEPFLTAWRSNQASSDVTAPIAVTATGAVPLWIDRGVVRLSGEADLTDYHSPLGGSLDDCMALVAERYSGHTFSFDSLPVEALEPLASALDTAGVVSTSRHHDVTLVIDLPADAETWLASLSKKHRHAEAFAAFIAMHRSSRPGKGGFMTEGMERFFWSLITDAGAAIDLITVAGSPVAAAFGFVDADAFYLYNSAYAEDAADASPGIVLLASMIERSIDEGLQRFDFLKGDERYKYRLGAVDRPLSVIEGTFP